MNTEYCTCEDPFFEDMGHGEWKCTDCDKYADVDLLVSEITDAKIEDYQLSH